MKEGLQQTWRRSKHHKCPKSSTMLLFFMSDLTCLTKPGQMWWSPAHFTTVMNFYWQGPKRPNGRISPKSLTNNGETCRVCVEDSQMWDWTQDPNDTLMTCARGETKVYRLLAVNMINLNSFMDCCWNTKFHKFNYRASYVTLSTGDNLPQPWILRPASSQSPYWLA